jgi:AcrR family transcriptional regulator
MQRGVTDGLPELAPGKGAQTPRGVKRRDIVLKVAAKLFSEKGFDSVSINDIGLAAGITGPAIYRYFVSKEALLVSVYDYLHAKESDGIKSILSEEIGPWESLERMLAFQIALALDEAEKIRIVNNEERHLPTKEAGDVRAERRSFTSVWTDMVGRARPDLARFECEMTVHAVFALINSITLHRGEITDVARTREHLLAMAMSTVSAGLLRAGSDAQSA